MRLDKELMLLSVVSVVFLAGCTGGGKEAAVANGVIIKSFAPDLQQIDPDTSVTFTATLKNVGGKEAKPVRALLFGLSNEWTGEGTTAPVKGTSSTALAAADPTTGLPGEETSFDWTVTFPVAKGKNTDVTYDANVRVFYTYKTDSDTLLRFVTSDYLRTNPNVQKGVATSQTSAGPLIVTAVARTPSVGAGTTTGRVQFEIQNAGSGRVDKGATVTATNAQPSGLDLIKEIKVTGAKSCAGTAAAADVVTLSDVRLTAGKSKIISCEVDVTGIVNFKDSALKLTATYDYFVDSASQVTVLRLLQ